MKKSTKIVALALSSTLALSAVAAMAACKPTDPLAGEAKEQIVFWGNGDANERGVFQTLVDQFNELYRGEIYVKYEPQISGDYNDNINAQLAKRRATVDVFYVEDALFKSRAEYGYLAPLDDYIKTSTQIDPSNMWDSSLNRYLYDVNTTTQDGPDAHYYGVPKDIGPTVIFYNEDHFTDANITVISVAAEDLAAFNAGTKADSRGKTKSEYGITGEVKEKGYFELGGKKYFNNQVAMSWKECDELAELLQTTQRAKHNVEAGSTGSYYGYLTEWWFSYGWSVGGDCIEYVADPDDDTLNGGYWEFTLLDETKNYIVADDVVGELEIGSGTYKAGEIVSWQDKLTDIKAETKTVSSEVLALKAEGKLNELPSQKDAMVEFVSISQLKGVPVDGDVTGLAICPQTSSITDAEKTKNFKNGFISMLVDGRWNVVDFRDDLCEIPGQPKTATGGFNWDVAPLPMYKEYDEEGNITVHGIEAGHSGSVALAINAKSEKKDSAWKFLEFIGGETGQKAQSESGFAIPSQKDIANTDVFLQPGKCPQNASVFVRAAANEHAGDWWYLSDRLWITPWADALNGEVRGGKMTLTQFANSDAYKNTNNNLREYTAKK